MDEWRGMLAAARRSRGIGRAKLAQIAGVSAEAVRGYEVGRRRPRQPALEAIIAALEVERPEANAIREGAGYAPVRTLFDDIPNYMYSRVELPAALEESAWPAFVTNDSFEVVAANGLLRRLWGLRPDEALVDKRGRRGVNVLTLTFERRFYQRITNWSDVVARLAGTIRGRPVNREPEFDARAYLATMLPKLDAEGRGLAAEMLQAWLLAPPTTPKVRWRYRIDWQDELAGLVRFDCLASPANEAESLEFNEWIPVGAESWMRFEQITSA